MKRISVVIALILIFFMIVLAKVVFSTEQIVRLSDGKSISFARMMSEVKKSGLVFVGEIHDRIDDHRFQLAVISALHEQQVPLAIGMEMFAAESQRGLDEWVAGTMDQQAFLQLYYSNWKMPWPLYKDILLYAREHRIPVIGINVPSQVTSQVARHGFAALSPEQKAKLPPDITCDVDSGYLDFIRDAYGQHHQSDKSFLFFCEAQMVWDKAMAWHLTDYLQKNPATTVVVLAGSGHVMRKAIPRYLTETLPYPSIIILPDPSLSGTITPDFADYLFIN